MARAKLATDRLLECVCVCVCLCVYVCVFMYVFVCMCVYVCGGGKHFFFRRERQAVEAHRQVILPATANPRTANPEGKPQTEGKPQVFRGSPWCRSATWC